MLKNINEKGEQIKSSIRDEIKHVIIGISLAVGIISLRIFFTIPIEFEVILILLAEMFLFMFVLSSRIAATQDVLSSRIAATQDVLSSRIAATQESVNNHSNSINDWLKEHSPFIRSIEENLRNKIRYKEKEEEIIQAIQQNRDSTIGEFCAMWCIDYEVPLEDYFIKEKQIEVKNVKRCRLFNVDPKSPHKDHQLKKIRDHLLENKDSITKGDYLVFSTGQTKFEIIICMKADHNDTVAFQVFRDVTDPKVGLALYSKEKSFVLAMQETFNSLKGKQLIIENGNPDKFETCLNEWLSNNIINDRISVENKAFFH